MGKCRVFHAGRNVCAFSAALQHYSCCGDAAENTAGRSDLSLYGIIKSYFSRSAPLSSSA
jgi:hypothetical protein